MTQITSGAATATTRSGTVFPINRSKYSVRVVHIYFHNLHVVEKLFAIVFIVLHTRTTVPENVQFLTAHR